MWGIGLILHFLKAFVLVDKLNVDRERMIEEEMKKMKKLVYWTSHPLRMLSPNFLLFSLNTAKIMWIL